MSNLQNDKIIDDLMSGTVSFKCDRCGKDGSSQDSAGWERICDFLKPKGYYMLCDECKKRQEFDSLGYPVEKITKKAVWLSANNYGVYILYDNGQVEFKQGESCNL